MSVIDMTKGRAPVRWFPTLSGKVVKIGNGWGFETKAQAIAEAERIRAVLRRYIPEGELNCHD